MSVELSVAEKTVEYFNKGLDISVDLTEGNELFGIRTDKTPAITRYFIVHTDRKTGKNLKDNFCNITKMYIDKDVLVVKSGLSKHTFPLTSTCERANPYAELDPILLCDVLDKILSGKVKTANGDNLLVYAKALAEVDELRSTLKQTH